MNPWFILAGGVGLGLVVFLATRGSDGPEPGDDLGDVVYEPEDGGTPTCDVGAALHELALRNGDPYREAAFLAGLRLENEACYQVVVSYLQQIRS